MKVGKKIILYILALAFYGTQSLFAQIVEKDTLSLVSNDSLVIAPDDPVLIAMDSLLLSQQLHWLNFQDDTTCLNIYGFEKDFVPLYNDSVLESRIENLNRLTPLDLRYNAYVKAFINVYVVRRRELTSHILGLAKFYYPLFEEKLDMFDIPLEMKHLAVVESALYPKARSKAGASGLWQFMYATGRQYDLEVTSYIDERSDPYESTIAACRYFKFLYSMYGDWNLVLAAYNSGPGNVNKAIRRSGGKKDYWEIRPFLPRETRGYVPAFIAVNYFMNYQAEHNLYPLRPQSLYGEIDTLRVQNQLSFEQISQYTNLSIEELENLNPVFKKNILPTTLGYNTLYLPKSVVGLFLANEDSIYNHKQRSSETAEDFVVEEITQYYVVKKGDVLGVIAEKHGVSTSNLKEWNNIRNSSIYPGQKLEILKAVKTPVNTQFSAQKDSAGSTDADEEKKQNKKIAKPVNSENSAFEYHTIQNGDTLWDIANKYPGVTVSQLRQLNNELNFKLLKPGQRIKIKPI